MQSQIKRKLKENNVKYKVAVGKRRNSKVFEEDLGNVSSHGTLPNIHI